jgi:hypothetical protein
MLYRIIFSGYEFKDLACRKYLVTVPYTGSKYLQRYPGLIMAHVITNHIIIKIFTPTFDP